MPLRFVGSQSSQFQVKTKASDITQIQDGARVNGCQNNIFA